MGKTKIILELKGMFYMRLVITTNLNYGITKMLMIKIKIIWVN